MFLILGFPKFFEALNLKLSSWVKKADAVCCLFFALFSVLSFCAFLFCSDFEFFFVSHRILTISTPSPHFLLFSCVPSQRFHHFSSLSSFFLCSISTFPPLLLILLFFLVFYHLIPNSPHRFQPFTCVPSSFLPQIIIFIFLLVFHLSIPVSPSSFHHSHLYSSLPTSS